MLHQYFQANGSNFTKLFLVEALVKARLQAVAESHNLFEIYKPDKSKERNLDNLQHKALSGKENYLLIDFIIRLMLSSNKSINQFTYNYKRYNVVMI